MLVYTLSSIHYLLHLMPDPSTLISTTMMFQALFLCGLAALATAASGESGEGGGVMYQGPPVIVVGGGNDGGCGCGCSQPPQQAAPQICPGGATDRDVSYVAGMMRDTQRSIEDFQREIRNMREDRERQLKDLSDKVRNMPVGGKRFFFFYRPP